jgi:hypothetical protein
MSKEFLDEIHPKGAELQAAIHEAKYQILMRLWQTKERKFENETGFKDFQTSLHLYEVEVDEDLPTVLLSRRAFERALNRARREGWIYMNRIPIQEGLSPIKLYQIGLTKKGEKVAEREQIIIWEKD